jgi:ribose transport system substrate-binding protein
VCAAGDADGGTARGGDGTAPVEEGLTLGLSLSTLNNPFFVTLKEGAEEAAAAADVELIVVDAQDDAACETPVGRWVHWAVPPARALLRLLAF